MKKFIFGLLALISLALTFTGCEMTYGEDKYQPLVQWFAPHTGDTGDWINPGEDKTVMKYNSATGKYEIEIETGRKNVGITLCTDTNYGNQRHWDHADAKTQANFNWKDDFGNKQLIIKNAGKYLVAIDPATLVWSVTAE